MVVLTSPRHRILVVVLVGVDLLMLLSLCIAAVDEQTVLDEAVVHRGGLFLGHILAGCLLDVLLHELLLGVLLSVGHSTRLVD